MSDLSKTPPPLGTSAAVAEINTFTHCESSENYHRVLMQFEERWRLIVCSQNHQLILQRRESLHGGAWRGIKYFLTKNGLLQACGVLGLLHCTDAAFIEDALPPDFKKGSTIRAKI